MGLVVSGCLSTSIVKSSSQPATKAITRQVWLTRVLPVGAFAASTMALGNMAYLYLGVSFIQMLKALSPVFTMLGLFMGECLFQVSKVYNATTLAWSEIVHDALLVSPFLDRCNNSLALFKLCDQVQHVLN